MGERLLEAARELIAAEDAHEAADVEAMRAVFQDDPNCDEAMGRMDDAARRLDAAWDALREAVKEAPLA